MTESEVRRYNILSRKYGGFLHHSDEQVEVDGNGYWVKHSDYAALQSQVAALVEALEYVLEDEPNMIPRASSKCRNIVRAALTHHREDNQRAAEEN